MFDEERDPDTPEEEGAPGEPGEGAPSDESAAVGPEIEGAEALSAAAGEGEPEADEPAAEEPAAEEEPAAAEEPAAEEPAAEEEPAAAEEPAAEEEPAAAEPAAEEGQPAAEAPAAEGEADAARDRRAKRERGDEKTEDEVIPGMHLEPDLVLEEQREDSEFGQYADADADYVEVEAGEEGAEETPGEPEPVAYTPLDLAADARYGATGKRKSAVARVILKPGEGTFSVNGRHLDEYFPRVKLQRVARQPLEAAGYNTRMDVVARIHGGGVAAQATALRHGIARALVEADPALRGELKRRGYLTRDPRVKERKKAGLKKARKRPQFSKR
jgi:small subunit ribosomal protein S9